MDRQQQYNNILKGIVKRIGITILCCLPAIVLLGYWLQNVNKVARMAIFIVFMLVVICIVEYIHIKFVARKQITKKILHKNQDVFK